MKKVILKPRKKNAGVELMKCRRMHNNLNAFALRDTDGKLAICTGHYCFANFREHLNSVGKVDQCYLAVSSYLKKFKAEGEATNKYLQYILKDSIFSKTYKTKTVGAAKRYGVSMDVNQPKDLLQCGLIAIRRSWEYPVKIKFWYEMVERGVHPHVALMFSIFVCAFDKGIVSLNPCGHFSNHEVFYFDNLENIPHVYKNGLKSNHSSIVNNKDFRMDVFTKTNTLDNPLDKLHGITVYDVFGIPRKMGMYDRPRFRVEAVVEKLKKFTEEYMQ